MDVNASVVIPCSYPVMLYVGYRSRMVLIQCPNTLVATTIVTLSNPYAFEIIWIQYIFGTYKYIYIYTHIITHIYIYIYRNTHTNVYIYIHARIYTHTHIYIHMYIMISPTFFWCTPEQLIRKPLAGGEIAWRDGQTGGGVSRTSNVGPWR